MNDMDGYMAKRTRRIGDIEIVVLPRQTAILFEPTQPAILISIGDPGQIMPPFVYADKYLDICRVCFYDVEDNKLAPAIEAISGQDARKIAGFIIKHYHGVQGPLQIVIHCEAGQSRSAGVAAAICMILDHTQECHHFLGDDVPLTDGDIIDGFEHPFCANRRVYYLVAGVLQLSKLWAPRGTIDVPNFDWCPKKQRKET